jgi:hypothetical protein
MKTFTTYQKLGSVSSGISQKQTTQTNINADNIFVNQIHVGRYYIMFRKADRHKSARSL